MAKFRIDTLDHLARQLTFSPSDTRLAQIAAAEDLLHTLDPAKAYPLDFVIFRITGYHPLHAEQVLLPGSALQHDLGQLIEIVSDSLAMRTSLIPQPVLDIDDVCEKFNVTSKTIQRWRRRGLPARRFVFPDGKRRVGFLLSSVERFISIHEDQVAQSANFTQVDDLERDTILRRARRLILAKRFSMAELSRRIARRLRRSPLTILHILRKHDQENPAAAIAPLAAPDLSTTEKIRIIDANENGLGLFALARRLGRASAEICRILLEDRIHRLKERTVRFIDDPLYHQPDAQSAIDAIVSQDELAPAISVEAARIPRDLPPYLTDLYRVPLLTPAGERALFLKFNYAKYLFVTARRRLDPDLASRRDLQALQQLLDNATDVKNDIVRANLRLVVSVARKHLRPGAALMELVSEGNITLMRAVEGFDFHKGNRFSTYATFALMKGFARSVPQMIAASRKNTGDIAILADVADGRLHQLDGIIRRDQVGHLLSRLDERERQILSARFGINQPPQSPEELANGLGLTRQRIRQIQEGALEKLRQASQSL